ncbi:MAG: hypothetical protein AVDCRST_MAG41-1980, partial [uncultured Corynebacteriales bacterium]
GWHSAGWAGRGSAHLPLPHPAQRLGVATADGGRPHRRGPRRARAVPGAVPGQRGAVGGPARRAPGAGVGQRAAVPGDDPDRARGRGGPAGRADPRGGRRRHRARLVAAPGQRVAHPAGGAGAAAAHPLLRAADPGRVRLAGRAGGHPGQRPAATARRRPEVPAGRPGGDGRGRPGRATRGAGGRPGRHRGGGPPPAAAGPGARPRGGAAQPRVRRAAGPLLDPGERAAADRARAQRRGVAAGRPDRRRAAGHRGRGRDPRLLHPQPAV